MRLSVVLACLLAACMAEKPRPCTSPPLLTGDLTVSTQNEKLWVFAKFLYDAMGQRVRLMEMGNYQNKSFTYDALLLFREGAMYEINEKARTCKKSPLKAAFHPMEIPKNASLLGQAVVGSSSRPGEGLLVNTWTGDLPGNTGKYITTFTEFGCIPVSTAYQTKDFGWMLTSFFNNVIGIPDPNRLNPPDYCPTEMSGEQPGDFASLFFNLH